MTNKPRHSNALYARAPVEALTLTGLAADDVGLLTGLGAGSPSRGVYALLTVYAPLVDALRAERVAWEAARQASPPATPKGHASAMPHPLRVPAGSSAALLQAARLYGCPTAPRPFKPTPIMGVRALLLIHRLLVPPEQWGAPQVALPPGPGQLLDLPGKDYVGGALMYHYAAEILDAAPEVLDTLPGAGAAAPLDAEQVLRRLVGIPEQLELDLEHPTNGSKEPTNGIDWLD